jgi:hypothetical protein
MDNKITAKAQELWEQSGHQGNLAKQESTRLGNPLEEYEEKARRILEGEKK